ncbi:hypothetical protein [Sulfurimonas sp.]
MQKIYLTIITTSLVLLSLNGCSKEPTEPYYDRAKAASEKAHNKLSND